MATSRPTEHLEAVQVALGHRFRNRHLLDIATSTDRAGFGSLEHVGDTVADLAVGLTTWRDGGSAQEASGFVTNAMLDEVYDRHFAGLVNARSGDVVEALVGAVHRDAGFPTAARVAVTLCAPDMVWSELGTHRIRRVVPATPKDYPVWLGALTLEAFVADHVLDHHGLDTCTQETLTRAVQANAARDHLEDLGARLGLWPWGAAPSGDTADQVRASLAATLVVAGWATTSALLRPHLVLEPVEVFTRPLRRGDLAPSANPLRKQRRRIRPRR